MSTPRISPSGPVLVIEPPTSGFDPIFQQFWLDTTKPDGGNGSIGAPFNLWDNALQPLQSASSPAAWVINLAQGLNASSANIPNMGGDGHSTSEVSFKGVVPSSIFAGASDSLTNVTMDPQDNGRIILDFTDLIVDGLSLTGTVTLKGENAIIADVTQTGTVTGSSHLINCSLAQVALDSWDLRMDGGTVDGSISVDNGFLNNVEFFDSVAFRWASTLNLTNCRFRSGGQLLCSSSNQLNLDLDTWGSMVSAGITFPDTTPTLVITPWMPVIGDISTERTDTIGPGVVAVLDMGEMFPQRAEPNHGCVAIFSSAVNSNMAIVGSFIDGVGHLTVLVKNSAVTSQDLNNGDYTITYLPRISP